MPKIIAKKRGNALGFWFFHAFLKLFGLRGAYGLLYFVSLHYLLFDRQVVTGAMAYIKRRFPESGLLKKYLYVYLLFVSQGKQLIDRYAVISNQEIFDIGLEGFTKLEGLLNNSKEGFLLLTAHMGNWQIAMTALKNMGRRVHLVMRPEDNPAVKDYLNISKEGDFIRVISPEEPLGGVIEIMNALKAGDIVSFMGDRHYGFEAVPVTFLGGAALFPFGAFNIAAVLNLPIVVLLSAKLPRNKYIVDVTNIIYPRYEGAKGKVKQLQKYVQEFATILEGFTQKYPLQCFLFHDVWENGGLYGSK